MDTSKGEVMVALPLEYSSILARNNERTRRLCIGGLDRVRERLLVCVTSCNSYFGSHLVKKLLARGYLVRSTIQYPEDFEDVKAFLKGEDLTLLESIVVAKMENLDSLCQAFRGCDVVFHTSSFIDPHGVSGYKEGMVFAETEGAKNVIEACARSARVKRCVFTSSLLACVWNSNNYDRVIDESCWSDEDFCREKKLWLALGKTRAEKAAWVKAMELKVKLVTACPGLLMAPSFPYPHIETSLPYLKGGKEMLQRGTLATENMDRLADIHIRIYEAMDYGACGRYTCFERVIKRLSEAIRLEDGLKMPGFLSDFRNNNNNNANLEEFGVDNEISSKLSNAKVAKLLLKRLTCKQQDDR